MSGVYPYCVVRAGCHPPGGLTGLGGGPVEGRDVEGFTVWTSAEPRPPPLDLDAIARHHAVVRAASDCATPIPVRFGAWAADHAALMDLIRRRRSELEATLSAIDGCVELGVTVEDEPTPDVEDGRSETPGTEWRRGGEGSGRAYLRELSREYAGRRRRRDERDVVLEKLRVAVGELTHDERVRNLPPPGLVSVAHLVAVGVEPRYREGVAAFAREHGATRVHLTGPWPPYSFASS